jgi:hypothetical protein
MAGWRQAVALAMTGEEIKALTARRRINLCNVNLHDIDYYYGRS